MSRRRSWASLAAGFSCALAASCQGEVAAARAGGAPVEPISLTIVLDRPLPLPELRWANDLRWSSDRSVWIVAARAGTFEIGLSATDAPRRLEKGGESPDGLLLAADGGIVAAAVPFGPMSWIGLSQPLQRAVPMTTVVDFDLWNDELLFLGARRDEEGQWAPEGGILWRASIKGGISELSPRMYSASGSGAIEVAQCGILRNGAVRYFEDGRYAVVPGFQPGAFLYDRSGRLLQAWDTVSLGFYQHCDLGWDLSNQLKRESRDRRAWLHQRPVLDEVFAWNGWPALLIRQPRESGTTWQLVVLHEQGASQPVDLPIVTRSIGSRIRGERRGDRLALVVSESGPEDTPSEAPRLIVLNINTTTSTSTNSGSADQRPRAANGRTSAPEGPSP